jgi:RimJ/RimL family protein N-acetyltransferase
MKPVAELKAQSPVVFSLRTIGVDDIESLREWKNNDRQYFFHKTIIAPEQQRAWYAKFSQTPHDHMFAVWLGDVRVGCIGARLLEDGIDVYNVILGRKDHGRKGIMSAALKAICTYVRFLYPGQSIRVRVLKINPAIRWYQSNGFVTINTSSEDHIILELRELHREEIICTLSLSLPVT